MTREDLLQHLVDSAGVDGAAIEDDTSLFASGLVDSVAMVDLIVFLESAIGFKVGVADMRLDNLDSVSKIMAFVGRARAATKEST